jgi:transposase InsO family protein
LEEVKPEEKETETVTVLVSRTRDLEENMLIRSACIGGIVLLTAFDSCATNCFVSENLSKELTELGHVPIHSPVAYDVRQGNPLCVTNLVHMIPVTLVSMQGRLVQWHMCMFIVANTGAEAIIGYPTLAAGGIITYDPPEGYEQLLLLQAVDAPPVDAIYKETAMAQVREARTYTYGPPSELAACFLTKGDQLQNIQLNKEDDRGRHYGRGEHRLFVDDEVWVRPNEIEFIALDFPRDLVEAIPVAAPASTEESEIRETMAQSEECESHQDTTPKPQMPHKPRIPPSFQSTQNTHTQLRHEELAVVNGSSQEALSTQANECIRTDTFTQSHEANLEGKVETVLGPAQTARQTNELSKPHNKPITKKKRGETEALTPNLPFGQNAVLPEEVIEALLTLKQLSEKPPENLWTKGQLDEIQAKLSVNRPEWSNCLTMTHIIAQFDEETASTIENLMNSERFQKSTFCKSLRIPAKVNYFDINQKPGVDWWNPPKVRRYKNPLMYDVVDKMLDWQLEDGLLSDSVATRPAPCSVVEKEARDPRCCFDYRLRNERTDVPVFPMPDIQEFLDETMGYEYYCSFDMAKMFNQIEINPKHRELAAFITHRGVYDPHRIQFGLAGGPQHAVREVGGLMQTSTLTNGKAFTAWAIQQNANGKTPPYVIETTGIVKGSNLKPFIDDVFIKANDKDALVKIVELFFEFCEEYHLLLSRKKANICKTHLKMLGMVVSKAGKHLDPSRIITLLEAARPRSKVALQSLLCSYNFVRMFVPNFSSIVAPLYDATKGIVWKGKGSEKSKGINVIDPAFIWTEEMTKAYDVLRAALLTAPILVVPIWSIPLFLSVDASIKGEGWVLWQLVPTAIPGQKVAVAILYGSRKYTETESAWETTRQEATAIKDALVDIDEYVFGQSFYLFSDHLNLRWMHNSVNRAVIRMRNFLSQYRMTIVHCPGIWNNADSHSRLDSNPETIKIASELNSATEAKMLEGNNIQFSRGTDTTQDSLDNPNEGTVKQVYTYKDTHGPHVYAFRTKVSSPTGKCDMEGCSICTIHEEAEDAKEDEIDLDDFDPFKQAKCLHTLQVTASENVQAHEYREQQWSPLIRQICDKVCTDMSHKTLLDAATTWNSRTATEVASCFATETLPQVDEPDIEDYNWCGKMQRNVFVMKTATYNQKSKQTGDGTSADELAIGSISADEEHFFPVKGLILEDSTRDEMCIVNDALADRLATITIQTQTLPEDFRAASIKIPKNEDFEAVHGGLNGHHGLDYSYRKLFNICGSKWANERGEATKVKEALKQFIEACPVCQKVKSMRDKIQSKHSFIISRPFLEVSYDFVVFTETDKNGNRYLLVAIDNFTRLVEMKATRNKDAETVARFLLEIQSRYGPMARLRSDRDPAFTGLIVTYLNRVRNVEQILCIPYHPQANSICERQNAIIMQHISAMCVGMAMGPDTRAGWSDLVPLVFSIVNNTPKNPLGISPLSMIYGVFANYERPLLPPALIVGKESNPVSYVEDLMKYQNRLLMIAEDIQSAHLNKYVRKYDKELRNTNSKRTTSELPRQIHCGDFVIVNKNAKGGNTKLTPKWVGPRLVLERGDNDPQNPVVELMDLTDMTTSQVSLDDCLVFNTGWFEEMTMMQELVRLSANDDEEFIVEQICDHRPVGPKRSRPLTEYFFRVKWKDFADAESSWEPWSSMKDLEPFLQYAHDNPLLNLTPEESKLKRKTRDK